jgi:hypothetical protein
LAALKGAPVLTLHHRSQGSGLLEKERASLTSTRLTADHLPDWNSGGLDFHWRRTQQRYGVIAIPHTERDRRTHLAYKL